MEIKTIGGGKRLSECAARLAPVGDGSQYKRAVLFPIPTSRDNKYITGTDISIASLEESEWDGVLAVGYGIPEGLSRGLIDGGAHIYDLSLDEGFLLENAILTAKGALGVILTEFPRDVADMKIGIIGYGRIGSALLSQLLFLGARPKIYTTRRSVCLSLCESGVDSELVGEARDLSKLELIVNTAPARLISEEMLAALPEGVKIMELASGKNFPESGRVMRLASIPETMYPETGGRIMAEYVKKKLYPVSGEVLL